MLDTRNTFANRTRIYALDADGSRPAIPNTDCTLTCADLRDLALQELPDAMSDDIARALHVASQQDADGAGWVSL